MADPTHPIATRRIPAAFPPRWAFFKGLFAGAVIEVPALAAGVWLLAHLGIGDPEVSFVRAMRLTALFAGVASLLTAAGVGRLAAHASIQPDGGRPRAMRAAARAHAAASAGLLVIAMIPHGMLPEAPLGWLTIAAMGALIGIVCGLMVGAICGSAAPVKLGDVMAAAIKAPGEALRQLLDPEDLLKLGAAVRDRTTHLFDGMFVPAERPPGDGEERAGSPAEAPPPSAMLPTDAARGPRPALATDDPQPPPRE